MNLPDNFSVTYRGQRYRPVRARVEAKKDGSNLDVIDWETTCPDCGMKFTTFTTHNFNGPRKRCDLCKLPEKRAKPVADVETL
jgi:hypothetical protein